MVYINYDCYHDDEEDEEGGKHNNNADDATTEGRRDGQGLVEKRHGPTQQVIMPTRIVSLMMMVVITMWST